MSLVGVSSGESASGRGCRCGARPGGLRRGVCTLLMWPTRASHRRSRSLVHDAAWQPLHAFSARPAHGVLGGGVGPGAAGQMGFDVRMLANAMWPVDAGGARARSGKVALTLGPRWHDVPQLERPWSVSFVITPVESVDVTFRLNRLTCPCFTLCSSVFVTESAGVAITTWIELAVP